MLKHFFTPVILALLVFFVLPAKAQSLLGQANESQQAKDTVEKVVEAIRLNNVNTASAESFTLYNSVLSNRLTDQEKSYFGAKVDSLVNRTTIFLEENAESDLSNLNFRDLEILGNTVLILENDINDLQEELSSRITRLEQNQNKLENNKKPWELTLSENSQGQVPRVITRRINMVLSRSDSVKNLVEQDIDYLLTRADQVTGIEINLGSFRNELDSYSGISGSKVLKRDMPPLWGVFVLSGNNSLQGVSHNGFLKGLKDDTNFLIREYSDRLILIAVIIVLLIIIILWLNATVEDPNIKKRKVVLSLFANEVFKKPVEISLLIALYILWVLIPEMPVSYASFIGIVSVYAVLRIALDIIPSSYRKFLLGFAIAYLLFRFYNLFYEQQFISRFILLGAQVVAVVYLFSFVKNLRQEKNYKKNAFNKVLFFLGRLYLLALLFAVLGNVMGALSFAELISGGVIKSGFLVLTSYVGFHVTVALIYLMMSSNLFRLSNIIKKQFAYIFSRLYNILRFAFVLSWILVSMEHFMVREIVIDSINDFLHKEIKIGAAAITLMDIFLFILVIWLSVFITRIVRTTLQEEVFPRIKVKRGMPGTIVMLVRIALITIGFMLAAAAAGMNLSSLTIIIGAFSVGIGFGLQNIFNNLVSGLILAFERPIKEGDIVEVNSLLGHVKRIGIRSSVVRTFSGAEVIVPNGELISNDLTNWTLSDQYRRSEIQIGVAYGTNPEQVIEILLSIAKKNKFVIPEPEPRAYFIDFGDSSLNFRLLAWMDQDYRFEGESEIRVAIDKALKAAGIEIPFPQRDIHLKTMSDQTMGQVLKVKGEDPPKGEG